LPRPKTFVYIDLTHTCGHAFNGMCQERDKPYWLSTCDYECGDCMNAKDEVEFKWAQLLGTYLERYIAGRQRYAVMTTLMNLIVKSKTISCNTTSEEIESALRRMSIISDPRWWIVHCVAVPNPSTLQLCMKSSSNWRALTPSKQTYFVGIPKTQRDLEGVENARK